MNDQIESMPNQNEFDYQYNLLNSLLLEILNSQPWLGNVVLLSLISECLNGLAHKTGSIESAKSELKRLIDSLEYIDTKQMN